jgi:glyoxylase I family protein
MLYTGIDHPAIACQDVRKLAEWYCRHLGMRIVADNGTVVLVGYGGTTRDGALIELMPVKDEGPNPATFARFQPGIRHLGFRVTDFETAYEKLKELKVEFTTPVGQAVGGGKTILFRDPEGNELQIVER